VLRLPFNQELRVLMLTRQNLVIATSMLGLLLALIFASSSQAKNNYYPPAWATCEQAPVSSKKVAVPAGAAVKSIYPGDGRPIVCWIEPRTP
jgi:hypothetical protein